MLRWIVRAIVSLSVVAVLVTVASTAGLRDAFSQVRGGVWLASLGVFMVGHALNAMKYRWLLQDPQASPTLVLRAHFAGLVANLGLPGVAGGDVVRATWLLPYGVRPAAATVASVLDRAVDTATLFVLIGIGALAAGVPPALREVRIGIRWPFIAAAIVGVVVLVAGGLAFARRKGTSAGGLMQGLAAEIRPRLGALVAASFVTATVQSAFVLTNLWMADDLGLTIGTAPWFVAWPLSKLISILPISLGGIGVREAALVSLLAPYGAPSALVFASGLLWQGVLITSGLVGLGLGSLLGTPAPAPASSSPVSPS